MQDTVFYYVRTDGIKHGYVADDKICSVACGRFLLLTDSRFQFSALTIHATFLWRKL